MKIAKRRGSRTDYHFLVIAERRFRQMQAMNKNLTLKMGNCNHRKYIPMLLELVERGAIDPAKILTQVQPFGSAIEAYQAFERRQPGWMKVEVVPGIER